MSTRWRSPCPLPGQVPLRAHARIDIVADPDRARRAASARGHSASASRPRGRLGPAAGRAMMLATLALSPDAAAAGEVILLRATGPGPQAAAIAGFTSAYRGRVTEITVGGTSAGRLMREIAVRRPDAVVAVGLSSALFARDQLPGIPIVYCAVQDPARHDLSGDWITGVSARVPLGQELALLRTASPAVRRVAVFYGQATGAAFAAEARAAAREAGLELIEVPLANLSELANRARESARRADALWMPADPTVAASEPFRFLLELSLERRIPFFAFSDALVRAGALAAVIPDYAAAGAQAAGAVRRLEAGERVRDIPPMVVGGRLVVNAATARAIGLDLPLAARREHVVLP